ncbi:MAG: quinone oxidoreductase family protein [Bryobacteraceae bacterium]
MRAWLMDSYEGVERLRLGEVPDPEPREGEVLLLMHYAALNPADAFLAQAQYPAKPTLPHILGRDGVGEVLKLGPGVDQMRVGEVVGILRCEAGVERWGTFAEKTVVPAASVARIPEGWSEEEMAAAPLVYLTAWQALVQWGGLPSPGQVLLVTGASGGVGVAAVMLGKTMGMTVVALSRSAEKARRLRELGADHVFDPSSPELKQQVLGALGGKRVDLVVDNVAGPLLHSVLGLLGYGGRVSAVGRSGGTVPEFNPATLFFRRIRIGGVAVGDYTPEGAQAAWAEIVRRLREAGRRPVIDRVFGFEDLKQAFRRLAEGPMGKVLVRIA